MEAKTKKGPRVGVCPAIWMRLEPGRGTEPLDITQWGLWGWEVGATSDLAPSDSCPCVINHLPFPECELDLMTCF